MPEQSLLAGVVDFWSGFNHIQSYLSHNWFIERRVVASIMVASWRIWYWVEITFKRLCASALATHDKATWVGCLAHAVLEHVFHRRSTTFLREKFLPLPPMPVQMVQSRIVSGDEALETSVEVATKLIHQWIQLPCQLQSEPLHSSKASTQPWIHQSRFVHVLLCTTLNANILFLPAVQHAWRHVPDMVFGKRGIDRLPATEWAVLYRNLLLSGIGDQSSSGCALVYAHATVCAKHPKAKALEIPVLSQADLEVLGGCTLDLEVDFSPYWRQRQDTSVILPVHLHPSSPSTLVSQSTRMSGSRAPPPPAARVIKSFLLDFFPLCSSQPPLESPNQRQQQWLNRMDAHKHGLSGGQDYYNPLRELASSRQRVTSPQGPFTHNFIRTSGGFFSALIFRGITFSCSRFLGLSHNNRFATFEDWTSALAMAKSQGLQPQDICNKAAYGTTQRGRSPDKAGAYWVAATTIWPELLHKHNATHSGTIPWADGLAFLNRKMPNRSQLLPEIGGLTAYLLAVDLVYAGVFDSPTASSLGTMIFTLNLGARKGMQGLELVTSTVSALEFASAFATLYEAVSDMLTDEESRAMRWDLFVLEHALCKGRRLGLF